MEKQHSKPETPEDSVILYQQDATPFVMIKLPLIKKGVESICLLLVSILLTQYIWIATDPDTTTGITLGSVAVTLLLDLMVSTFALASCFNFTHHAFLSIKQSMAGGTYEVFKACLPVLCVIVSGYLIIMTIMAAFPFVAVSA